MTQKHSTEAKQNVSVFLKMTTNKYLQRKLYDVLSNKRMLFLILASFISFLAVLNYFEIYLLQATNKQPPLACTIASGDNYNCPHCLCEPIDVVYTWVNGSDPHFQRELRTYATREENAGVDMNDIDVSRFDDKYELKYSLRSLEKNMPWIGHVYIVTNGQIPHWLDMQSGGVTVVSHASLVSQELDGEVEEILPTFSSPVIEIFIHRIPGLSERFIYINDDIIIGQPVHLGDWCWGDRMRVAMSWGMPDCLPGCPWPYIGDGSCDSTCNNEQCQFDGGDCDQSKNPIQSFGSQHRSDLDPQYAPEDHYPDQPPEDKEASPGQDKPVVEDNSYARMYLGRQLGDLELLNTIIKNEKDRVRRGSKLESQESVDNVRSRSLLSKIDENGNSPNTLNEKNAAHKAPSLRKLLSLEKIKNISKPELLLNNMKMLKSDINKTIHEYNRVYLKRKKRLRRIRSTVTGKFDFSPSETMEDRRYLDSYARSLIFSNRIFNEKYGFKARKVPSHMPYLLEQSILNALHVKFANEIDAMKRHRFRRSDDLQFAFSYYHFMLSEIRNVSLDDVFDTFDTDGSGTWSDREIRTLLAKRSALPLQWDAVVELERLAVNCTDAYPQLAEGLHVDERERYMDSRMPIITLDLIKKCGLLSSRLRGWFGTEAKYGAVVVPNSKDNVSAFKQLVSNASAVLHSLDDLRRNTRKFICINDNLDAEQAEENELVRALLLDFYEALFPVASRYELAAGLRNKFARLSEYDDWVARRRNTKWAICLCAMLLIPLVACQCVHCYKTRRKL